MHPDTHYFPETPKISQEETQLEPFIEIYYPAQFTVVHVSPCSGISGDPAQVEQSDEWQS